MRGVPGVPSVIPQLGSRWEGRGGGKFLCQISEMAMAHTYQNLYLKSLSHVTRPQSPILKMDFPWTVTNTSQVFVSIVGVQIHHNGVRVQNKEHPPPIF